MNIQENSELDLLVAYRKHEGDKRAFRKRFAKWKRNSARAIEMPGVLPRLAQYELTLMDWIEANRGSAKYVVMANKCWPAFQTEFGFVPCYVNSRLTAMGYCVGLRGGYLRRAVRIHRHLPDRRTA